MWFWLFVLLQTISGDVCEKCICSKENTIVRCRNLTEIPFPLPWNLKKLVLDKNVISSINESSLNNCFNLKYLDLSKNNIFNLPHNIFRDVPIKYLNLYHNKLDLSDNTEVFLPLSQSLIVLNISL